MSTRLSFPFSIVLCLAFVLAVSTQTHAGPYDAELEEAKAAYYEGRYQEAIQLANHALQSKDNPQYCYLRGLAYFQQGTYEEAVEDFTAVLQVMPYMALPYYYRANAYNQLGKPDSALADYARAAGLSPGIAKKVYQERIEIYLALGKEDEAARDFVRVRDLEKMKPDELLNLADSCLQKAETTFAAVALSQAIEKDSTLWLPFVRRGYVYHQAGKDYLASADFARVLQLVSEDTADVRLLAEWFYSKGLYGWAVKAYSAVQQYYPTEASSDMNKGYAYFHLGRPDSAVVEFSGASAKCLAGGETEQAAEAFFRCGEAYLSLDSYDLAEASFQKAKELKPGFNFTVKLVNPASFYVRGTARDTATAIGHDASVKEKEIVDEGISAEPSIPGIPPRLSFTCLFSDQNNNRVLDGGERVSIKLTVTNRGGCDAKGVRVLLSGTSKALGYLGREKVVGAIPAGREREVVFEAVLPYQVEPDEGSIIIRVTEAQGFGALEEKELQVAMQPARIEREVEFVSGLVDVDQPLGPASYIRDDAYAVVIGISQYRSDQIPTVNYAKRDAESMKEYLVSVSGIPEGNIIVLTDDRATLSDLSAYLEEWLQRNVREGSFVFVYFAGHGTPNPEKGDAYLVPYDGEPGFISKLYPLKRLYSSLQKLPAEDVVVVMDACFSGAGGRSIVARGVRPLVPVRIEEETRELEKIAVLTASAGSEISQDFESKRHGLFTYYLLKGLRGAADNDNDGWVTLEELHDYVTPKVKDESRRLGYTQTPQFFPQPVGVKADIRIAKVAQ